MTRTRGAIGLILGSMAILVLCLKTGAGMGSILPGLLTGYVAVSIFCRKSR
ncbi:hypothetical protein [Geothrix sp. 21YS21S-2]|uniref:hypothetical protein n=1 Tax=Geothrix sp. 21YS21S-2 TaxID=3068893 RepID=UPI0027B89A91|nr:hypothetical protein [Geothrix sp. 21YS21S-2]